MDEAIGWLRQQVEARLKAAQRADTGDHWKEEQHYDALFLVDLKPSAGELDTPEDVRTASLGLELCQPFEDPRFLWACHNQATHIVANDPRDVIARCEAELAILNLYRLWAAEDLDGNPALGAAACAISDAVRHLASGYRHRDGYTQHWAT